MAVTDITGSGRVFSLETVDQIFQLVSKSIGIVDLIGHVETADCDDHSLNSASWAVKDMLREIQRLVETSPKVGEVAA